MTATAQTVTLIDRVTASIAAGEGTITEQWDRMTKRERALFDGRSDYVHAVMAGLERLAHAA